MDIADKIKALSARVEKQRDAVTTEEACKTAFVMPFLSALGYDVFDPHVVIPEFTADVGVKKGEKVDYAIRIGNKISLLIECKCLGVSLAQAHMNQLFRYFSVTDARFAILTNGSDYWFYTDLDQPNKMDQRPFFTFNILDYRPSDLDELQKFTAAAFDVESILSTASNLKYSSAIKVEILKELEAPSEELIRLLVGRVFDGRFTVKVKEDFAPLVAGAFREAIRDQVNQRLTSALESTASTRPVSAEVSTQAEETGLASEIETTQEELEAYHIIKAIVRSVVKADRIHIRDSKSYCAILLDDNNRKPLIRLHFNGKSTRAITLFGGQEEKFKIESLDDIYGYADRLRETAAGYDAVPAKKAKVEPAIA